MRAIVLTALYAVSLAVSPRPSLEYEVKAAFVLNFITFTEWPATAFESPASPLRICLVGPDPFDGLLATTVQGESVAGHALVIEHAEHGSFRGCHVVFVPGATATASDLEQVASIAPVLTIGESDNLWRAGAAIRLTLDGGKVRFDINQHAAAVRGLRFSPRLLTVARQVK